jgi:ELWxxDGT repeat protein
MITRPEVSPAPDKDVANTRQCCKFPVADGCRDNYDALMISTPSIHLQMCRSLTKFARAFGLMAFLSATVALAQPVRVVPVTPETTPVSSGPRAMEWVNNVLYFDFWSGGSGGLWKSDGTATGTVLVKDVPVDAIGPRLASGGKWFFYGGGSAALPTRGLWVTDGTLAGTQPLIATGTLRELVDAGGTLYFADDARLFASNGTPLGTRVVSEHAQFAAPRGLATVGTTLFYWNGQNLWKTDGTGPGTQLVRAFSSWSGTAGVAHAGKLFFGANDGTGMKLWVTDGTPGGTVPISGAISPSGMASVGPYLYFVGGEAATGRELWRSDGTPGGTMQVADIHPGAADSNPFGFVALGNTVIFTATTTTLGRELWKTDGTAAGTVLVKDIMPGGFTPGVGTFVPHESRPWWLTPANGALCFTVDNLGRKELWRTDGTEAGTILLMDDVRHDSSGPKLASTGTRVYFSKRTGTSAFQLWSSDCTTPAGNVLVKDFPGQVTGYPDQLNSLTAMGSHLLLRATTTAHGNELWRAEGSAGTLVKDVEAGTASGLHYIGPGSGFPLPEDPDLGTWARVGSTFYFSARTSTNGNGLWRSDGTSAGTVLVKDLNPTAPPNTMFDVPYGMTDVNGTLFFVGNDGYNVHGSELWKSDGTEAGTVMVKDIRTGPESAFGYHEADFMNVNGTLFFKADDGVSGTELWKTDGTPAGTVLVKDIRPGPEGSGPHMLGNLGGVLLFSAGTVETGWELWRSDGTAAGTTLVKDVVPGSASGGGSSAVVMGGALYFASSDGATRGELWKSDGTTAGTSLVFDTPGFLVKRLTAIGNALYFWAGDFQKGGFWKSDGTPAGTVLLASTGPQQDRDIAGRLVEYEKFVSVNGAVYFVSTESGAYTTLWRTDGTPEGTYRVDLFPGFRSASPAELTVVGDRLYFVANDGVNPRSLFYYVPRTPAQEITRLGNLSSRMQVLQGDNVMIGGFIVGGPMAKCVAIVATGPSLSQHGVTSPLQDPKLTLVRASDQAVIATNDNWQTAPPSPCIGAEAFVVTDAREARIVAQLPPGAYTAIVQGANESDMGVAVLGIYELGQLNTPLTNISARGPVFGGEHQMIGGFVIQGTNPQTVAVVATGPSLVAHGIPNALQNPVLTIVRQSDGAVIATIDNWMDASNAPLLEGHGFAPPHANEAAILVTLPPGAYTAVVSGANDGSGIGVVGVYRVN